LGFSQPELEVGVLPVRLLRRRYLAIRVEGEEAPSRDEIEALIRVLASSGRVNPTFLRLIGYDSESRLGIVRCSHRSVDDVKVALSAVTDIFGKHVTVRIFGVSGTIRALRRKRLQRISGKS
jgi:RNase P/RNase MRP subunit POP5